MPSFILARAGLTALTQQVGRLSLQTSLQPCVWSTLAPTSPTWRHLATGKDPSVAEQHQEWVRFQQSIAVEGFETGQTTTVQRLKKSRGGRTRRSSLLSQLEDKIAERQRLTDVGGGEYPPLRYSDEETERLLAEAYAAVPDRAGKRGTRNLKRQGRRWHLVRQVRKKYQYHLAEHQERKMEARSLKMKAIKTVLVEAPALRERDRSYQAQIAQRWAATMQNSDKAEQNEI